MHEPYTRLLRRADESQKGRNREYLMFFFTPLELFIILVVGFAFLTLSDIVINVVKDVLSKE